MSETPRGNSLGNIISRSLTSAFYLRKGETWPVVMMLLFSFFIGMASAFLYSASVSLFLAVEGNIVSLPYIYIISALIIITSGFAIDYVQSKVDVQKFMPAILLFVTVVTLAFGACSWFGIGGQVWLFGVIIWFFVITSLINIVQLALPSLIFDLRQSKRLYGLITSGELLASSLGFLLVPLLVSYFGTTSLVTFSSVTFLFATIITIVILRKYKQQIADSEKEQAKDGEEAGSIMSKEILHDRYIIQLCLLVFFSLSSYYFIDFAFNRFVSTKGDASDIATFIGYFFAAAEGLVFFIKTFLSGRIVNKYGVRVSLSILPVLLLVGTVLGGAFSPAIGFAAALAIFIQLNKLFDTVFRSAVHEPGFAILYQPLRPKQRMSAQTLTQGIVDPLSMGLAGAALIFLAKADFTGTIILVVIILLMTAGWIIVTYTINRDYTSALMRAMKGRVLDNGGVSLDDMTSRKVLLDKLKSPLAGEVMYALNVLEKNNDNALPESLLSLAEHHDDAVRIDVLERIARLKLQDAVPLVSRLMQEQIPPRVRAAAVKAFCALYEEDAVDKASTLLDDPNLDVRIGAMTGLLRNGGIDGILVAAERLIHLGNSASADERRLAARIIGEVGVMSFYRPLRDLIHDSDKTVQDAALEAAGKIRNLRLLPVLIETLGAQHIHATAAVAITSIGLPALPSLAAVFDDKRADIEKLTRTSRVIGRIRGPAAVEILKRKISDPPEPVRNQVLISLNLCQFRATEEDIVELSQNIRHEMSFAHQFLQLHGMLDGNETRLLRDALLIEAEQIRSRVFYMLSFMYDARSIFRARDNLIVHSREHRAYAMEMLDTELTTDLKKLLFPLIEEIPAEERVTRFDALFGKQEQTLVERIRGLLTGPDNHVSSWTKACAIRTTGKREYHELLEEILVALKNPEHYVRETAVCAVRDLDPVQFAKLTANVRMADPSSLAPIIIALTTHQATPMLLTIEKVIILKTVDMFSETPDDVLVEVASILEEETAEPGKTIINKGDVGNCMYIIHEGRVRVHDGDVTYTELGARQFFGEFALLDNDTRSASITAIEETVLLRLDQEALYEIMSDRIEVARGIIRELTKRIRRQNETLMKLKKGDK